MKLKKLLALLLTVLILAGSISTALTSGLMAFAEETTGTAIKNSPREFLKQQAIAFATAEGADSPTVSKNRIAITQDGAWRVESAGVSNTTETATVSRSWADTTGLWVINSASNIRYGHSTWSYDCAHIRVGYNEGNSAKGESLAAFLYPKKNNTDGDRRNAFLGLYYIAETSGEYTLTDNYGGFTVRESAASGHEVYITILANGEEIFKSQPISRVNRIAKFSGETFYLEKGQKLEIKFTYEYTAETYDGSITIDFDPELSLTNEYVETPTLEGTGDVSQLLYNEISKQTGTGAFTVTQTSPWRVQGYKSSKWSDLGYCKKVDMTGSNSLYAYYMSTTSHTQSPHMGVRFYGTKLGNPKVIWVRMPLNYKNTRRPVRLAYTAEADGVYTLSDKYKEICGISGTDLNYYEITVSVTVNDEKIWTGENKIRSKSDSVAFNPIQVSLKKGDVLAIEYNYATRADLAEGVTAEGSTSFTMQFAPELSYQPAAETEEYSAADTFKGLFDDILATSTSLTTGTLTQPESGWRFKYGTSASNLTTITKYSAYPDKTWGEIRLHANTTASGDWPSIKYRIGSDSPYGLMVHYRNRMSGGNINQNGYHYNFAYSFKVARQGVHVLDETTFGYSSYYQYKIDGILKIYKNGELFYTSEEINSTNTSTVIPKMNLMLNVGDELTFYFERLDADTTLGYNWHTGYSYMPTITYHKNGVPIEKTGYKPENNIRYYAENIAVPTSVSAYIKTNEPVPGNIIGSNNYSLSVLANGNLKLAYLNGETKKEIIFPVNIKGEWKKVTVEYDSANSAWNCLLNDVAISTVEDADFVAENTIGKLYIGASDDVYNNGYFKGEIAELTLNDGTTTTKWALSNVSTEANLKSETVTAESDCSDTFITFPNRNHRYDLYENFTVPVSTFETWVRLKTDYADGRSAGRILSSGDNYPPYAKLNIIANGKPQLTAYDSTTTQSVTFNVDIRSDEFVHLAITADTENGIYKCYINGVLADTVESSMVIPVSTRPYLVSGDYYYNNAPVNFEGDIAGIALYSDVRTESEIIGDIYGQTDLEDTELLGKWSFADKEEGLVNQNGNGNDFHPVWETEADSTVDESYGNYSTFVFIPDIQNFTQSQGEKGLNNISKWILDNKEKENIVGVMGLGDITNLNTADQWEAAQTALNKLKGEVPTVLIQGNHDIGDPTKDADGNTVYRNTTNLNAYFPLEDWKPYLTGYFEEGKIDNIYTLTEDDKGIKYMLLGLEFQPRDEVLEWANEVVAAHPDYNVIVSTHGYQSYYYTTHNQYYISSNSYAKIIGTNQNTGDAIWEKFVRKHANITTVVCGHVYHEDIHVTTAIGDNGNVVTEIVANAQTSDVQLRMSGTIMIVRVSEDGTKANVNYYATHHGHYLKDLNQFEMDWNTILPEEGEASIGGENFATLQDAITAAKAGDEIILNNNITLDSSIVVDKALTINLNGFTITSETDVYEISADGYGVMFENGIYTFDINTTIADADKDGNVTALDITYFRNKVMGDIIDTKYFDINGDGKFNAVDIVNSKKIIVQ